MTDPQSQPLAEWLEEHFECQDERHNKFTVGELLDESMDHIEAQGRAPTTVARYRSAVSANIKPHLGSKSINKLGRRISTASTVSWPSRG